MRRTVFVNGNIADGRELHTGLAVVVQGGLIAEVTECSADMLAHPDVYDLDGNYLAPGYIDIQVNGGGGVLFNNAPTVESLGIIARAHRQFGTTALLPTLISDTRKVTHSAILAVEKALQENLPGILGIHLEGPCINTERKGVHAAKLLSKPDDQLVALLTSLKSGTTLVTLAPEIASMEMIKKLKESGIVVFAGHSTASFEVTILALEAGVSGFTHLFNAMPPLLSREPGMVGAALSDENSFFGIIADGFHVHPATFAVAVAAKKLGRALLVTDAMASVGSENDTFTLYGERIEVVDGRCLNSSGSLAGSDLNMCDAVKNAISFAGLDIVEALRMASTNPANAINRQDELGYIRPGYRACLVELDAQLNVVDTWIDGDQGRPN